MKFKRYPQPEDYDTDEEFQEARRDYEEALDEWAEEYVERRKEGE